MSDMKLQVVNNEKYYNIISLRYGADIATLIKLRLNEINRLVVDELDRNGAQNAELTSPPNSLLLSKIQYQI